ncbi:MAG: GGDEF domain-containing protein [Actinomycetota bacterium]
MSAHPRPLDSPGNARRVAPFGGVALFALAALPLASAPHNVAVLVSAALATAALVVAAVSLPWTRLPAWSQVAVPLAYFPIVALLREGLGGVSPPYASLVMLPIIWLALYGTRRELYLGFALGTTTLTLPVILIGEPAYPAGEWGGALVWMVLTAMTGLTVNALVRESKNRADLSDRRARTISAVAEAARCIATDQGARPGICEAALSVSGATFAALLEPEEVDYLGERYLRVTASAGIEVPPTRIHIGGEPSGAAHAFSSGKQFVVPRAENHPGVSQRMIKATRAKSVVYEPVLRGTEVVGVLLASWSELVDEIPEEAVVALELLATEAAIAIERSDLHQQLARLASTDVLTGVANRRTWNEQLTRELSRARRSGHEVALALLDLDYFKVFNDEHGHQAGDRLLKLATATWSSQLREVDLLARLGGDEFALLLPECDRARALSVVERLRAVMPEQQSCSAGIACWDGVETAEALQRRADLALYEAKRAGRDRFAI